LERIVIRNGKQIIYVPDDVDKEEYIKEKLREE